MSPLRKPCPKTVTSKADATAALDAVLDALNAEPVADNQVVLAGFGTVRNPRARNPQTDESLDIAESTLAAFKSAAPLKRAVAGN